MITNNEKSYFASLDKVSDVHNISYHHFLEKDQLILIILLN